jgi:hypothetical protein
MAEIGPQARMWPINLQRSLILGDFDSETRAGVVHMPQYSYSLNGENWMGAFATRDAALAAAIQKCSGAADPPGTVFVGEVASGEMFATQLGQVLVEEMRSRARNRGGEGAGRYLRDVTSAQLKELDGQIETVLVEWVQAHQLMPETFKVEAISEHLVPMPHRGLADRAERSGGSGGNGRMIGKEVQDLGVGDFPGELR